VNTREDARTWGGEDRQLTLVTRNLSTRYLAIGVDGVIGLMLMPFNVSHLGQSAYGLWALTTSITMYFSVLDLGYGGSLVKFVAQYRAWRDRQALNEILSTMFVVFTVVGLVTFLVTAGIAWQFGRLFSVTGDQVRTGQHLLLVTGSYIAFRFAASIFGAVVFGFQRFYLNNLISVASSIVIAVVNVLVLNGGADLVTLVIATTSVRVLTLGAFVTTGYLVYPGLQVTPRLFRRSRLREVTGFSIYILVLDWSAKLNYSTDALVIGAMLNTSAVAVWTVGQRIAQICQQLTIQLSGSLFPFVVDSAAAGRGDRLGAVLMHGTSLSLAFAVPVCTVLSILAGPVVQAWMGPNFHASAVVLQLLLAIVLVRVANATANMILKGTGQHRLLAFTNAGTAITNILLSIVLIRPMGLAGVALGTLLPVLTTSAFVLFPSACARVGVPVGTAFRIAVWPAIWPAAGLIAVIWAGRPLAGSTLFGLAALLVVAGSIYLALFLGVAISRGERRVYWSKLMQLAGRGWRAPAAA
jgi:O-antigen/teichoic acid export membrane protein